jgi:hypothetical protein
MPWLKGQKISPPDRTGRKYEGANPLSVDLWSKEMFIQKLKYVHYNPVAAGLCTYPEDIGKWKTTTAKKNNCSRW